MTGPPSGWTEEGVERAKRVMTQESNVSIITREIVRKACAAYEEDIGLQPNTEAIAEALRAALPDIIEAAKLRLGMLPTLGTSDDWEDGYDTAMEDAISELRRLAQEAGQ